MLTHTQHTMNCCFNELILSDDDEIVDKLRPCKCTLFKKDSFLTTHHHPYHKYRDHVLHWKEHKGWGKNKEAEGAHKRTLDVDWQSTRSAGWSGKTWTTSQRNG